MLCHANHNLKMIQNNSYICACGSGKLHETHPCHICPTPTPEDNCTFLASKGKPTEGKPTEGKHFICHTCLLTGTICPACAKFCHFGHQLEECEGDYRCICGMSLLYNNCLFS